MEGFNHAVYFGCGDVVSVGKADNEIIEFSTSCLANSISKISFKIIRKDQSSIVVVGVQEVCVYEIVPLTTIHRESLCVHTKFNCNCIFSQQSSQDILRKFHISSDFIKFNCKLSLPLLKL